MDKVKQQLQKADPTVKPMISHLKTLVENLP
jgi:hypothetical protein